MLQEFWNAIGTAVTTKDSFWFFQAKDFVTLTLSLVAFMVAYASLRINYLRPPAVDIQIGSQN